MYRLKLGVGSRKEDSPSLGLWLWASPLLSAPFSPSPLAFPGKSWGLP